MVNIETATQKYVVDGYKEHQEDYEQEDNHMSSVDTDSIDLEEDKKYYLISPDGSLFHEIPLTETDYLTREVWVSYCPSCGKIQGYYYSKSEANRDSRICEECTRRY